MLALLLVLGLLPARLAAAEAQVAPTERPEGLPPSRFYSYDEIGNITRNAHIGFDALGRLAVIDEDAYVVLNDNVWLDLIAPGKTPDRMQEVAADDTGRMFFGALGAWGELRPSRTGLMEQHRLTPGNAPDWVRLTSFTQVLPTHDAVYFANWNGVVRWDRLTRTHQFFERPGISRIFELKGELYVSAHGFRLARIDVGGARLSDWQGTDPRHVVVDNVTTLDEGSVLLSSTARNLYVFDGREMRPWANELESGIKTKITDLQRVDPAHFALAVSGRGLFLLTPGGKVARALTSPDYHRIRNVITQGDGSCWLATETGVTRLLHGSPLGLVDQRLGLPVFWPQVQYWRGRPLIASSGRLYARTTLPDGSPGPYQLFPEQPRSGTWGIAVFGEQLLLANNEGVWARDGTSGFQRVLDDINASRLVMTGSGRCYVIGEGSIALIEFREGRWNEVAARVPGAGYPNVVQAAGNSAWVELGANRALRISVSGEQLQTRIFDNLPLGDRSWVNVSVVGGIVVLSGSLRERLFFDEATGDFCRADALQALIESAPHHITRLREDPSGTLWASHERGVYRYLPQGGTHVLDSCYLDDLQDRFPTVQLPGNGTVWLSTAQSLYHLTPSLLRPPPPASSPVLASIHDMRSGARLDLGRDSWQGAGPGTTLRLPYGSNSLLLRFLSGSSGSLRTPRYEYRLQRPSGEWSPIGADSTLTLAELREGTYQLEVRLAPPSRQAGQPLAITLVIEAPWYRSAAAWVGYLLGLCAAAIGMHRWLIRRTVLRNSALEKLVQVRTAELKSTMAQLEAKTRNAATLEERQRLAGEIHDSVQQGLSGLILQLDGTLRQGNIDPAVRARLGVVRNMVAFTRQEVQHAVWNLESPLLSDDNLGKALGSLAGFIGTGSPVITVEADSEQDQLSQSVRHHLLRIAQEAITNAVRHGQAGRITVRLERMPGGLRLSIRDDGKGFDPALVENTGSGHFGLRGLKARAEKINAQLRIESTPGAGTLVEAVLGMDSPARDHPTL